VEGEDDRTWSDHTDVRPTMLTLVGLNDDYQHEGRVLVEKFKRWARPDAVNESEEFVALARALKDISAPLGPLGLASVHASTVAMESGSAQNDATYTSIENQLSAYTVQRDELAAKILSLLEAAEFDGKPIPEDTAEDLIHQARHLLSSVQNYARSITTLAEED
jgi:hypothetical protein